MNTTTRIFDVIDLDNRVLVSTVAHDTTAIGHNAYTEGRYVFASNYTAGLRVFSTNDVAGGELPEVAYFDVYPENDNASFEGGTWSNYPCFSQKGIVVRGIDRGLFILQPRLGKSGTVAPAVRCGCVGTKASAYKVREAPARGCDLTMSSQRQPLGSTAVLDAMDEDARVAVVVVPLFMLCGCV